MRYWVRDNLFDADLVKRAAAEFSAADGVWCCYQQPMQRKKVSFAWHQFPPSCWQLMNQLLRLDMQELTGLDVVPDAGLWGAGLCCMETGDFVKLHLDASHHRITRQERKLTAILFINDGWRADWGGGLAFPSGLRFLPIQNRLVIFENTEDAEHWVTAVTGPEARHTLTTFWYAKPPSEAVIRPQAQFLG